MPHPHGAISRSITAEARPRAPFGILRHCLAARWGLLTLIWPLMAGCQTLQKSANQQSARCEALCTRAREANEQGNPEQANQLLNEALRQRPSDVETRRQLAETMWNSGRRTEAVKQFASLCSEQPKDARLATRLAVMQWEANLKRDAANTALAVLQIDPQSKDAWQIKARSEVADGRLDEALVSYMRVSQYAPDDLSTLIELGDLHLKRGHPERACPLFRSAIQHPKATSSQRAETEWMLGIAYVRSQRLAVAVPVLERAIAQRPSSADDWCFLSWIRFQCGDVVGAQSDLQRALERDPDSEAARKLAREMANATDAELTDNRVTPAGHFETQ